MPDSSYKDYVFAFDGNDVLMRTVWIRIFSFICMLNDKSILNEELCFVDGGIRNSSKCKE